MNIQFSAFVAVLALAGCGGSGATPAPSTPGGEQRATAAPATFSEQVTLGQSLYGEHCADCHGASGEGTGDAPAVVGLDKGALPLDPPSGAKFRKSQFKTVADIADFVVKNMPPNKGGSLSTEEYLAILAFDLKANGIDLADKKLDLALAATLEVPRK